MWDYFSCTYTLYRELLYNDDSEYGADTIKLTVNIDYFSCAYTLYRELFYNDDSEYSADTIEVTVNIVLTLLNWQWI